jgi:hypothetical protein
MLALASSRAGGQAAENGKRIRIATVKITVILQEVVQPDLKKLADEFGGFSTADGRDPLIKRKAPIYARGYHDVQQEIAAYCSDKGIDLVLNDDSPVGPTAEDNPYWVVQHLRKQLVFVGPGVDDITAEILRRMRERRAQQEKTASAPAESNGPVGQ